MLRSMYLCPCSFLVGRLVLEVKTLFLIPRLNLFFAVFVMGVALGWLVGGWLCG